MHGTMSHGAPWSGKGGGGGKGGKGGGGGEGKEGGHALGPFKERAQSREAMGAMGRDGTMEPWGHEPLGRAEAAEKADEKAQGCEAVGAMMHGTNEAMERHGAGRAEGAGTIWSAMEREGRRGRSGKGGKGGKGGGGGEGGEGGHALGPFKVS